MDPFTLALIGGGLDAVGKGISGGQQNKLTKEQMAEQAREFNAQQNFAQHMGEVQNTFGQVKNINDLQRQIEMAPTRDKTLYMLSQRMGMVPQNFNPRDMMNPQSSGNQTPTGGGIDPSKQQAAMQTYQAPDFNGGSYKAGSGGVNPYMYAQLLGKLGVSGNFAQPHVGDVIANTSTVSGGPGSPQQVAQDQNAARDRINNYLIQTGQARDPNAPPPRQVPGAGPIAAGKNGYAPPSQIQPSFVQSQPVGDPMSEQMRRFRPLTMGRGY